MPFDAAKTVVKVCSQWLGEEPAEDLVLGPDRGTGCNVSSMHRAMLCDRSGIIPGSSSCHRAYKQRNSSALYCISGNAPLPASYCVRTSGARQVLCVSFTGVGDIIQASSQWLRFCDEFNDLRCEFASAFCRRFFSGCVSRSPATSVHSVSLVVDRRHHLAFNRIQE